MVREMRPRLLVTSALSIATLALACDRLTARGGGGGSPSAENDTSNAAAPKSPATPGAPAPAPATPAAASPGGNVIGVAGIAAWTALPAADKAKLKITPSIYLHQSVGQDLEDGAEENGFKFTYYGPGATSVDPGLNGGLFNDVGPIDNGKPMEKLALVLKLAKLHRGTLKVIGFSFGYADVRDEDLTRVEAEYVRVAKEVRATGVRLFHVTPPLVFDVKENPPKMKMRTWMLATFAGEPIFDLQDIESQDNGKRCEVGGVWQICPANRSTTACSSKSQGVDNEGQGHLCSKKAAVIARALLLTLSRAGG